MPAAAQQQAKGMADMSVVRPASPGVIGKDHSKWPAAFRNARGDSFVVARFEGFDASGLAQLRMGGPAAPPVPMDIGARSMSRGERIELAAKLQAEQGRAPLLVQPRPQAGGGVQVGVYAVEAGNAQALKLKEVGPAVGQALKNDIMDKEVFANALKSLDKEINALKLSPPPRPQPGQPASDWLGNAMNDGIVQGLNALKGRGIPYQMGGKGSLESAGALDCSGFASSLLKKVGSNIDKTIGKSLFLNTNGSAADLVSMAQARGGRIDVGELLKNPRPGCLVGLSTGAAWAKDRPKGIDHVGITYIDKSNKAMIAEFRPGNPSGLHVTPLADWINRYERKGVQVHAATPDGLVNQQVLAQVTAGKTQTAQAEQAPQAKAGAASAPAQVASR